MKVVGKSHETLIRRIDKNDPESNYYELYPITTAANVFITEDEDESLAEYISNMNFRYNIFIENIQFPVNYVKVFDGFQYGEAKTGDIVLTKADFGLGNVDNTSDMDKPVTNDQKTYVNNFVANLMQNINTIMDNMNDWNKHLINYNNPHRVTWDQVTNHANINPADIVTKQSVENAIRDHNNSSDTSTLHPEIINQINALRYQVNTLNSILEGLGTDVSTAAANISATIIAEHNSSPTAHSYLVNRLNQLSIDITNAINRYSGITGSEQISNKVTSIDVDALMSGSNSAYDRQYPSITAIQNLITQLSLKTYSYVRYFARLTRRDLDNIVEDNPSGIIFVEEFIDTSNITKGTNIFAFSNKTIVSEFNVPANPDPILIKHMTNAPTEADMSVFPDQTIIAFCEHSTSDSKNQSIVTWFNGVYSEFVIRTMHLDEGEHPYLADMGRTNVGYNFSTMFPNGYGILFCSEIDGTPYPGVCIYNKDNTPTTKTIRYGGNPASVLIKDFANESAVDLNSFDERSGIAYIENMYNNTSGIPGIKYYANGVEKFSRAIPKLTCLTFAQTINGSTSQISQTITFNVTFRTPPKVICVMEGFDMNGQRLLSNITVFGAVTDITTIRANIKYNVTNGIIGYFKIIAIGLLQ